MPMTGNIFVPACAKKWSNSAGHTNKASSVQWRADLVQNAHKQTRDHGCLSSRLLSLQQKQQHTNVNLAF